MSDAAEPDHILALLGRLMDLVGQDVRAALPGALAGLRTSQLRLLSLTPRDGLRVTDLADRVGMSKQALGEFAGQLESAGLLESVRDTRDRRVRILRPTAEGLRVVAAGAEIIEGVEMRWRERVGPQTWDALRQALARASAA